MFLSSSLKGVCVLAALSLLGCGASEPGAAAENTETGPSETWKLRVDNHVGPVTLRGVPDLDDIVVTTTYSGPDEPARHRDIRAAQSRYQKSVDLLFDAPEGAPDIQVHVDVQVPPETFFQVRTGGGDIVLMGLTAGGDVDTSSGNIHADDVAGDLGFRSASGNIVAFARIGAGMLQALASDGSIEITIPDDTAARLEALAPGGITLEGLEFRGTLLDTVAHGVLNEAGGVIKLMAQRGSVTLKGRASTGG